LTPFRLPQLSLDLCMLCCTLHFSPAMQLPLLSMIRQASCWKPLLMLFASEVNMKSSLRLPVRFGVSQPDDVMMIVKPNSFSVKFLKLIIRSFVWNATVLKAMTTVAVAKNFHATYHWKCDPMRLHCGASTTCL
jgi:hypothetical protein